MSKLTDTQFVILSAASQRDDRGVELSAYVKSQAARKAVDKLIRAGLLEEVRAAGSLSVWRSDEENGPMALRIIKNGLEAIDVRGDEAVAASKETNVHPATARSEVEPPKAALCVPRTSSGVLRVRPGNIGDEGRQEQGVM
jgi:hypothetical protein